MSNIRTINLTVSSLPTWVPEPGILKSVGSADGTNGRLVDVGLSLGFTPSTPMYIQRPVNSWGSGILLPDFGSLGTYINANGGHFDWPGNEVYAHDVSPRKWRVLRQPSPNLLSLTNRNPWNAYGEYTDGAPGLAHVYDGIVAVPASAGFPNGRICIIGRFGVGYDAEFQWQEAHLLDPATGDWARSTNGATGQDRQMHGGVYDPARNGIWRFGIGNYTNIVRMLDLSTLTFGAAQTITPDAMGYANTDLVSTRCPLFGGIFLQRLTYWSNGFGRNDLLLFDPTGMKRVLANVTGPGPANTDQTGIEWCEHTNAAYCYKAGSNFVWKLTPPSGDPYTGVWTWSVETFSVLSDAPSYVAGDVEPYTNYRHNRWRYNKWIRCFMWHCDVTKVMQYYRPLRT